MNSRQALFQTEWGKMGSTGTALSHGIPYQAKQATLTGGFAKFLRTTVGLDVIDCVTAEIPLRFPWCSTWSKTMMNSEKFIGHRTGVKSTLARPESLSAWFMQPFGGERTTIARKRRLSGCASLRGAEQCNRQSFPLFSSTTGNTDLKCSQGPKEWSDI